MLAQPASYAAHQRARFMRPDAARYVRPDAARWLKPDAARYLRPGTDPTDVFPALDRKYSPSQPRVPAGNPDGGQWTSGDGGRHVLPVTPTDQKITDFSAQSRHPGHHDIPRAVFEKWNLPAETRKVFERWTTGTIPNASLRYDLQGLAYRHVWDGPNGLHGQYNRAVEELGNRFLDNNNIKPETMTPQQARDFIMEINASEDPRLRDFNRAMRLLRYLFRLRTGRE
jgi:hypothetical protein